MSRWWNSETAPVIRTREMSVRTFRLHFFFLWILTLLSIAGSESMVQQFTNFLHRAGMSAALDLGPDPTFGSASSSSSSTKAPAIIDTNRKRLILLEDLPNTSHYPTKLALRSALLQFLASPRATCPLVVIVSEAFARPGVGTESESTGGDGVGFGENVDARNVCGVEVLQNHACREISSVARPVTTTPTDCELDRFNPIAVTIMKKALVKILDRIYVNSTPSSHATTVTLSPNRRPSVKTLEIIIANSNGDIRSALMSLEFLAANPATSSGAFKIDGGKESGKGKKRKLDGETENDAKVRELYVSPHLRDFGCALIRLRADYSLYPRERARSSSFTLWEKCYTRKVRRIFWLWFCR